MNPNLPKPFQISNSVPLKELTSGLYKKDFGTSKNLSKTCTIIDFYAFCLGFLALYCFDIEWQIESKSLKHSTHPKGVVVISEVIFNLIPSIEI